MSSAARMNYSCVDEQIRAWAGRHCLTLFTAVLDGEARFVYISSKAGECFQIWIEPPADKKIFVHAAGIEGCHDFDPPENWCVSISDLGTTLEQAFDTVIGWMVPSERHVPEKVGS